MQTFAVGISGASGSVLAKRAVEWLLGRSYRVLLTATDAAARVWADELESELGASVAGWSRTGLLRYYGPAEIGAPIASGTYPVAGMLVIPASMATVSAIAHGTSSNLLTRAADVSIKERRRLVLVPRETPLSAIHLQNLLTLAQLGVVILPPIPAFYLRLRGVDDVVDFIVARALDALGVPDALAPQQRYKGEE